MDEVKFMPVDSQYEIDFIEGKFYIHEPHWNEGFDFGGITIHYSGAYSCVQNKIVFKEGDGSIFTARKVDSLWVMTSVGFMILNGLVFTENKVSSEWARLWERVIERIDFVDSILADKKLSVPEKHKILYNFPINYGDSFFQVKDKVYLENKERAIIFREFLIKEHGDAIFYSKKRPMGYRYNDKFYFPFVSYK